MCGNYLSRNLKKFTLFAAAVEICLFVQLFVVFYGFVRQFRELQTYERSNKYDYYLETKMSFYKGELAHPKGTKSTFFINEKKMSFKLSEFLAEFHAAFYGFLGMSASFVIANCLLCFGIMRKNSDLILQWFWVSIVAILVGIISNAVLYRIDESEDKEIRLDGILMDYSVFLGKSRLKFISSLKIKIF